MRSMLKEHIVTSEGTKLVDFSKIISLNSTATFLWESVVGKDFTEDTLTDLLLENYEVSRELAAKDVRNLIEQLDKAGVLEK